MAKLNNLNREDYLNYRIEKNRKANNFYKPNILKLGDKQDFKRIRTIKKNRNTYPVPIKQQNNRNLNDSSISLFAYD